MKKKYLIEDINLMKKMHFFLYQKYGDSINNYNKQKICDLIKSKSCNYLIKFQECTVYNDIEEYNKRFYHKWENKNKLIEFYEYYFNYLTFFCRPIFINFFFNNLLHYCYDVKADIFYQNNYKEEGDDNEEDNKNTKDKNEAKITNDKIGKINILVFDKETRNQINNSSNIISSIRKLNEEEQNMSYTQKLKINDDNYITLRNNKENWIEFMKEIKFNNNTNKKYKKKGKISEVLLMSHSSSMKHKISKNNLSHNITLLDNIKFNKGKIDSDKKQLKYIKLIKNNKKNTSIKMNNQMIKFNITKEKEQGSINSLKHKKIKKINFNLKNLNANIYNLLKHNLINYKSKISKNITNSKKNIKISKNRCSNINIDEKRKTVNNNKKKYKPKIIENKKNSLINTTDYFKNSLSISKNKSMKMKTINNNITNHASSLNKKQLIYIQKSNIKNLNKTIEKNIQFRRNSKKKCFNSIYFNSKPLNSNNNNLLQTYIKNCANLKKVVKSKSLLKNKIKTINHSIDQMKTFSVRLIKSFSKKKNYHDKLLKFINNYRSNYNTSSNISINEKFKKRNKQIISKRRLINKSNSNSIIKINRESINPKKNSNINKNEVKLNVNVNLHSIFININPSSNYHQNNNENLGNINKKIILNNNLYDSHNIDGKSMNIKKNKKNKILINNDYKNKTQSYKTRNKTKNKIKITKNEKIKGTNSFFYINTNLNNKYLKEDKNKILKRNNTIFKMNKYQISGNIFNKISLSINKK